MTSATPIPVISHNSSAGKQVYPQAITVGSVDTAATIKALIGDQTLAIDFRIEMFEIVRHGRLTDCLDAALTVIASPDEHEVGRQDAAPVLQVGWLLSATLKLATRPGASVSLFDPTLPDSMQIIC